MELSTYDINYSKNYRILKLTLEQKCVIAAKEIDDLREEIEAKQIEREKQLDHHKVLDIPPRGVRHNTVS